MIALARHSALAALDRAEALLAIAEREDILKARLTPDMFDFSEQVCLVADFARRAVLPPLGQDVVDFADGISPATAIAQARDEVTQAKGDAVAEVRHTAGFAELNQDVSEYLSTFALPNLWFHLSMAYGILRATGAPVGKADFDGLHAYPPGFSGEAE